VVVFILYGETGSLITCVRSIPSDGFSREVGSLRTGPSRSAGLLRTVEPIDDHALGLVGSMVG